MVMCKSSLSFLFEKGYSNLIVVAVSLLAILIPYFCGYDLDLLEQSSVNDAILSSQAQTSYGILLVSVIPSVIDTALDYTNLFHPLKWKKYIFGRVPIALTGFLVSIQFLLISDVPSIFVLTDCRAASYIISLGCLKIVFTGSIMTILTSIKPSIFSGIITTIISLFACSIIVIRSFTPGSSASFHQFSNVLSYLFLVLILVVVFYYLYKLIATARIMTVPDYICALYLFIYFVGVFGSSANTFQAWSAGDEINDFSTMKAYELAIVNYFFASMYVMLSIAPGRIARFEAVTHLVSSHNYTSLPNTLKLPRTLTYVYLCLYSITS